jgi:hypothetical protein
MPDVELMAGRPGGFPRGRRDAPILAEYGLRPITQISLGNVWSGLRFRPLKDGEAPFTGKG